MTHRRPAFTLLELLTVIAIMGLLMAIVIPSLSAARRSAKTNVCLSHLRGIGTGFTVYLNENEDRFPPFRLPRVSPTAEDFYVNSFGRLAPRWQWFLETDQGPVINPTPYQYAIRQSGHFHDGTPARSGRQASGREMTVEVFECPALDADEVRMDIRDGAYGYNYQYLGNTRTDTVADRWDNFAVGLRRITSPARTVVVGDSRGASNRHGKHSFTLDPPRLAVEVNAQRFGPETSDTDIAFTFEESSYVTPGLAPEIFAYSPVETRHNERANVVFVDAHAQTMSARELGYQNAGDAGIADQHPAQTLVPVRDPESGTYRATNMLWTGQGADPIAHARRPLDGG